MTFGPGPGHSNPSIPGESDGPDGPNGNGPPGGVHSPGGPSNPHHGHQPPNTDGRYQTYVAGYFTGVGTSTVGGNAVTIEANVTSDGGGKGALSATGLTIVGNHFSGEGTVMGVAAKFIGRIDGYDQDGHFVGARILVLYADDAGHAGRVAGVIVR